MQSGSFERLQWTFPLAVTLHNLEEAIWLPGWAARHSAQLPGQVTAAHFRLAIVVVTLAAYLVTWWSVKQSRQSVWTYLWVAYAFAMFLNVFVPHVPATILFHGYTPGVVSSVLVVLPVTAVLLRRVLREGVIPRPTIAAFIFGVPLGIAVGVAVVFAARLR